MSDSESLSYEDYDSSDPIHFDRLHKIKEWVYVSDTCMNCGESCDRTEEVDVGYGGPFELWCYCEKGDTQTFHPRVRIKGVKS